MNQKRAIPWTLEDHGINIKQKLAALWITVMLCYAYGDIVGFFRPGTVQDMLEGRMGPLGPATQGVLLGVAIMMSVPAVMVYLSLVLKPKLNRILNITFGIAFTAIMVITMFTGAWAYYVYLGVIEIILTLLITWHAWKWPKQQV